jgi:hypothetical protein
MEDAKVKNGEPNPNKHESLSAYTWKYFSISVINATKQAICKFCVKSFNGCSSTRAISSSATLC